ncbi:Bacteriophage Mu P [Pseudomonas syringae pv. maculicola str. M6]|nr:Bacteriophage Mu P [Pseudomonas syringae pv. maculicola str. M6]
MIDPNVVTLTVGDHDYAGWKSVEISAGIERQARSFEVSITWQWPAPKSRIRSCPALPAKCVSAAN